MSAPPALSLRGVVKTVGGRRVLDGAAAAFAFGSLTLIKGRRGAGKTTLARLLTGQTAPDAGEIRRAGLAAPLVGSGVGFLSGAPAARGLELRAAAYGLDYRGFREAVSTFLEDPDVLRREFGALVGRDRGALLFASAYLTPAPIYVIDGAPLPGEKTSRAAIKPLLDQARARAAVIWIAEEGVNAEPFAVDAAFTFERGALIPAER